MQNVNVTYTIPAITLVPEIVTPPGGLVCIMADPEPGQLLPKSTTSFTLPIYNNTDTNKKVNMKSQAALPQGITMVCRSSGFGSSQGDVSISGSTNDLIKSIGRGYGVATVALELQADMTAAPVRGGVVTIVIDIADE